MESPNAIASEDRPKTSSQEDGPSKAKEPSELEYIKPSTDLFSFQFPEENRSHDHQSSEQTITIQF